MVCCGYQLQTNIHVNCIRRVNGIHCLKYLCDIEVDELGLKREVKTLTLNIHLNRLYTEGGCVTSRRAIMEALLYSAFDDQFLTNLYSFSFHNEFAGSVKCTCAIHISCGR